jgi:PTH1 family peptidyl-tRNA hydrolase
VGFSLLQAFAKDLQLSSQSKKWKSMCYSMPMPDGHDLYLMMPQTFMNLSGEAVAKCAKEKQIAAKNILILHDEVDFDLGICKFKDGGGLAGHKGLKSISACIATQDTARLRLGVGPFLSGNLSDFVLKRFSKGDYDVILSRFPELIKGLKSWLEFGIIETMNVYNERHDEKQ